MFIFQLLREKCKNDLFPVPYTGVKLLSNIQSIDMTWDFFSLPKNVFLGIAHICVPGSRVFKGDISRATGHMVINLIYSDASVRTCGRRVLCDCKVRNWRRGKFSNWKKNVYRMDAGISQSCCEPYRRNGPVYSAWIIQTEWNE